MWIRGALTFLEQGHVGPYSIIFTVALVTTCIKQHGVTTYDYTCEFKPIHFRPITRNRGLLLPLKNPNGATQLHLH